MTKKKILSFLNLKNIVTRYFIDNVEHVMRDDRAFDEYVEFLARTNKTRQIQLVRAWRLANEILRQQDNPNEFLPKAVTLQSLLDTIRWLEGNSNETRSLVDLMTLISQELKISHKPFTE